MTIFVILIYDYGTWSVWGFSFGSQRCCSKCAGHQGTSLAQLISKNKKANQQKSAEGLGFRVWG